MPEVSIIVPVYNAEKTIKRCVESVLNQEFQDWELILMDDGSRDKSGRICDEFAGHDRRIKVVHKENSGVSDTRNQAISLATGTYLQFMDSDDWLTSDATNLFIRNAKEYDCDMVIADFYRVVGDRVSHKGDIDEELPMTREAFAEHMMDNPSDFYYGVLWNKLFKREIIEKFNLRMDTNISWCEDFMFNLDYLLHCEKIFALHVPIYYYVKTKGSLASQGMSLVKTIRMKKMVFEVYHDFFKEVLDEADYEKKRLQVYHFLVDSASDGFVPPANMWGTQKLGEERLSAVQSAGNEEGILMESYRDRKLFDRYLEQVSLQYDLKLPDIKVFLYISQTSTIKNYKELMDFTEMTRGKLNNSLKTLTSKGYIKEQSTKVQTSKGQTTKEKTLDIRIMPAATNLLQSISSAQNSYEQAMYAGLTEDEIVQYAFLNNKIQQNIQRILYP